MNINTTHAIDFMPLPLLKSGHCQTVLGSVGLPLITPRSEKQLIRLDDGNRLCCRTFIPPEWNEEKGIVLLLHGMGGSDRSHYMKRITSQLYRRGHFVFCLNRRGCGCGKGLSRHIGHAGKTDDILFVLKKIKESYPETPIQIAGFSSGGNILLKLLGELGKEGPEYISHGIAVSPVVNLKKASEDFAKPSNRFYEKYYIKSLIKLIRAAEKAFPDEKKVLFPDDCSMVQYDELYTVPKWGFQNTNDYYAKSSCSSYVSEIQVPCDLLYAEDDPIIDYQTIESLPFCRSLKLWKTQYGGHMGFLGYTNRVAKIRWLDEKVMSWLGPL